VWEGQKTWLDGHENEWKSATDGGGGGMHLQDKTLHGAREVPKNQYS